MKNRAKQKDIPNQMPKPNIENNKKEEDNIMSKIIRNVNFS